VQGGSADELSMLEGGLLSIFDDMHRPDFHLPLIVPLSFFGTLLSTPASAAHSSTGSIASSDMLQQYIDHRFVVGSPQHRLISECRQQRRLMLFLDGLGEVSDKQPSVAKYIAAQLAEENHPLLVSTCLPGELPGAVGDISKQLQLLPLSLEDQRRVLEMILPGGDKHPVHDVLSDIIKKPMYQQTASNPSQLLMLTNAVMTNSLRGNVTGPLLRAKLVSAALEQLIFPLATSNAPIPLMRVQVERLEHKNSGIDLSDCLEKVFKKQKAVKEATFKGYLRRLAYDTHQRKARSVTEEDMFEIAAEEHVEAGYPDLLMQLSRANAISLVTMVYGGDQQGLMLNQASNHLLKKPEGHSRPNTATLSLGLLLMQQFLSMKFLEEEFSLELADCGGDQDKFSDHVQLIFTEEGHQDYSVVRDPWWRPVLLQCANGMDSKIFAIVLSTLKQNAASSMIDLLEVAVYHADGVAARALLRGGVDPPTVFSKPKTVNRLKLPLHIAVSSHRPNHQFIAALLDVYPNATAHADADGMLPLHSACASGMVQEVEERKERLRLEVEAERVREEKNRKRIRARPASEEGDDHVVPDPVLLKRVQTVRMVRHQAKVEIRGPSLSLLQMLLKVDRGAAAKDDAQGRLPFHLLCACGSPSMNGIEHLFKAHPAAPFEKDCSGKRPLHHACASERVTLDLVDYLLTKEKTVVRRADERNSKRLPLHYACSNGACSKEVIERLLCEHPRASRLADANGELPVMLLLDTVTPYTTDPRRLIDTVQMLIEAGRATLRRHKHGGEGASQARSLQQIQENSESASPFASGRKIAGGSGKTNAKAATDQNTYMMDEQELARKWPQPDTESDDEESDDEYKEDLGKRLRRSSAMVGYDDSELESAQKMDQEEEMAARLSWMQSLSLR
jgi:ankyrin repeat protein